MLRRSSASDDTKKAMMKSFYESGGTQLSTNWSEVGAKKMEVKPPDGVEFKTWEETRLGKKLNE